MSTLCLRERERTHEYIVTINLYSDNTNMDEMKSNGWCSGHDSVLQGYILGKGQTGLMNFGMNHAPGAGSIYRHEYFEIKRTVF